MQFNSFPFALFFIALYVTYWRLGHRHQNRLLLVASYLFYGAAGIARPVGATSPSA